MSSTNKALCSILNTEKGEKRNKMKLQRLTEIHLQPFSFTVLAGILHLLSVYIVKYFTSDCTSLVTRRVECILHRKNVKRGRKLRWGGKDMMLLGMGGEGLLYLWGRAQQETWKCLDWKGPWENGCGGKARGHERKTRNLGAHCKPGDQERGVAKMAGLYRKEKPRVGVQPSSSPWAVEFRVGSRVCQPGWPVTGSCWELGYQHLLWHVKQHLS